MKLVKNKMRKYTFFLFLLCFCGNTKAQQKTIVGEVLNISSKEKIEGATVVLKSEISSTTELLAYSITSANGDFCLDANQQLLDSAYIEVKCIGFKPYKQYVSNNTDSYKIYLTEEAFTLKEVTIKAKKIKQIGDTISYNIVSFATAQDHSIGDVLSNMPGVSVADNGQISYNGNRISHLYIEGNDLFNEKYSIATQNLSYKDIARAEIIENHQPIKALASSNNNNQGIALNLKLKDGAKSKWGGYIQAAGGLSPNTWEGELFAANFSEHFQSASTLKSNNSGKLITMENEALTITDVLNMQNYKDSKLSNFIQVNPMYKSDLNENKIKVGASHIINNSNLWKINKHTNIQSQIIYSNDHSDNKSSGQNIYFLTDSILVMNTKDLYKSTIHNLQGELCIKSNQDNYYLNNQLHASSTWREANSIIQHNDRNINQNAYNREFTLSNEFELIKKYNTHILQINSYNNYTHFPENLMVKNVYTSTQKATRKLFFSNTQASHSFDWEKWNFTTKADFQLVYNNLNGKLKSIPLDTNFLNMSKIGHLQVKATPQITYKSHNFTFSFQVPLSYYQYKKKNMKNENHLFYMPDFFCKWKATPFFTLFASGSVGTISSGYDYMYINPIMSNYKTISSGFLSFQGKIRARGTLRASYANPIEMLFAHLSISKITDISNKQIEKTVSDSHIFYKYKPGNSSNNISITEFSFQKGLDCINGKVEWHTMYQLDKSKIIQNAVEEPFNCTSFSTDLNIKSTIASWLEFKYTALYSNHRMKSNLYKTKNWRMIQKFSAVCIPTNRWIIKIMGEHYYNHYDINTKQRIFLCDVNASYRIRNNEWFCNIQNIFNENRYTYTEYNDLNSQIISYNIRPRTIMIGFRRMF